jgi:6-phospho-3-hexuloisomerase
MRMGPARSLTTPGLPEELSKAIDLVLVENRNVLERIDYAALERLASAIALSKRLFVVGEGRSGLAIRMVAMRFMHLGCQVHVMGETTTPAMEKTGDVLIAFSGSGSTGIVSWVAGKAREIGGFVVAVTTQPLSPLGTMANLVITISAADKYDRSNQHSKQFAGSLFEQSALLLFDSLFHVMSITLRKAPETLWSKHTNLE